MNRRRPRQQGCLLTLHETYPTNGPLTELAAYISRVILQQKICLLY